MSNREAAIQLKLAKADNLLAEVPVLIQHHFYATAINRLYYACFHATKALLLTKDLTPKTHSGVVTQLHQHFVKTGFFAGEQAAFFSRLMEERIEDDYSDEMLLEAATVHPFIEPAYAYVAYIKKLIGLK